MKPLDVGAKGLVPFVEKVDDVKNIIKWSKYSPVGSKRLLSVKKGRLGLRLSFVRANG